MKLTNLGKSSDPYLTDFNLLKEKPWKIAISINRKIVTLTHNKRLLYRMLNAAGVSSPKLAFNLSLTDTLFFYI